MARHLFIIFCMIFSQEVFASSLEAPRGADLLVVSGNLQVSNRQRAAAFDLEMLSALPKTTITTTTIWTDGPQVFIGVSLHDLLRVLEVEDGTLMATAINDYAVEIPVSDAVQGGPIIAYWRNGAPMSLRDKGPLWIVYPYDSNPVYKREQIYARSIWQLDRIIIVDQ